MYIFIFISIYNKRSSVFRFALCTKRYFLSIHCAFYCMILMEKSWGGGSWDRSVGAWDLEKVPFWGDLPKSESLELSPFHEF